MALNELKRKPKRRSNAERQLLLSQIQTGLATGFSRESLMHALNLPDRTFKRYCAILAQQTYEMRLKQTKLLFLDYTLRMEHLFREAMDCFEEKKDVRFLSEAKDITTAMFRDFQSAGFIPRHAVVTEAQSALDKQFEDFWNERNQAKIRAQRLAANP